MCLVKNVIDNEFFWMYCVEVYDLLLSTVPCLSGAFVKLTVTHNKKKGERQAHLLAVGKRSQLASLSAYTTNVGVKMAFSLNHK